MRHTYGSLLVAGGIDLPTVTAAMGHARITTTERYLHARPASQLGGRFTRALAASPRRRRLNDELSPGRPIRTAARLSWDARTHRHLRIRRPQLVDHIDTIIDVVNVPDYREDDEERGRERFYRQYLDPRRWLRVVLDFAETPALVVTAFIQWKDPRPPR